MQGWLKSKIISQYLSYDKTEPPLTPPQEDNSFNNLK